MRFGLFHVALGAVLIAAGPLFGGPAWILAWPGWSVIVVGIGYLGVGPRVFGKRAHDGGHPLWHVALLFPYFAVAWTLWQLKSRVFRERAFDEVAPGIVLGRRPMALAELPPNVRVVVDLTAEFPRAACTAQVERYVCLPTLDTSVPSDAELGALLDVIAREPGPIYLHCAMGRGRSATVAAALLLHRGVCTDVDDAIRTLAKARTAVRLHPPQRAAVERLAMRLRERSGTVPADDAPENRAHRAPRPAAARP